MGNLLKYLGVSGVEALGNQQGLGMEDSSDEDADFQGFGRGYSHSDPYAKVMVSRPYILNIQNSSRLRENYVLFGSSMNLRQANFGNPEGIEVSYSLAGYTYHQLLAHTEVKPFTLGRIRIDLLDAHASNLKLPLIVIKTSSQGVKFQSPLTPYTALNQFITSAIEFPCNFEVDSYTELHGVLVGGSRIRMTLFPSHTLSPYHSFGLEEIRKRAKEKADWEEMIFFISIRAKA